MNEYFESQITCNCDFISTDIFVCQCFCLLRMTSRTNQKQYMVSKKKNWNIGKHNWNLRHRFLEFGTIDFRFLSFGQVGPKKQTNIAQTNRYEQESCFGELPMYAKILSRGSYGTTKKSENKKKTVDNYELLTRIISLWKEATVLRVSRSSESLFQKNKRKPF